MRPEQVLKENKKVDSAIRRMLSSQDGKIFTAHLGEYLLEASFDQDTNVMSFKEGIRHLAREILRKGENQ